MAIKEVSVSEAHKLVTDEGFVYLDVRTEGEFNQGHPDGSWNIPVMIPGPGGMQQNLSFVPSVAGNFPKNTKFVVGCMMGGRSMRACQILESEGFTALVNVRGGFGGAKDPMGRVVAPGWQSAGLPVSTACPAEKSYPKLKK